LGQLVTHLGTGQWWGFGQSTKMKQRAGLYFDALEPTVRRCAASCSFTGRLTGSCILIKVGTLTSNDPFACRLAVVDLDGHHLIGAGIGGGIDHSIGGRRRAIGSKIGPRVRYGTAVGRPICADGTIGGSVDEGAVLGELIFGWSLTVLHASVEQESGRDT